LNDCTGLRHFDGTDESAKGLVPVQKLRKSVKSMWMPAAVSSVRRQAGLRKTIVSGQVIVNLSQDKARHTAAIRGAVLSCNSRASRKKKRE
jgi:hypothetical protein